MTNQIMVFYGLGMFILSRPLDYDSERNNKGKNMSTAVFWNKFLKRGVGFQMPIQTKLPNQAHPYGFLAFYSPNRHVFENIIHLRNRHWNSTQHRVRSPQ